MFKFPEGRLPVAIILSVSLTDFGFYMSLRKCFVFICLLVCDDHS